MKVGFIGLGVMGKPMAKNLIKAGYELVVMDLNQSAVDELVQSGAETAKSYIDIAKQCKVIILMLPNSPEVRQVVLGEGGLIEGVEKGTTIIDMSSIAPMTSREVYEKLLPLGVNFLDAPVSGGEPKAIDGTLSVMVGGDKEVFDKHVDLIKKIAGSVVHVGSSGAGNTAKLCNQIVVAINIAAVSEAMILAKKSGLDPEILYQAIRGGLAGSTVMDAKVPMILERDFKPGFRIDLHIKDLNNVLETSHQVGAPLPITAQVMEVMQAIKLDGSGTEDHASIVKYYEKLANTTI